MNLSLFMLAGYETTSTTLSYCTYILAKYPEEQQKLYDEISSFYTDDESNSSLGPTADNVNKLEYLDMFIKEVLRMYPIGNR
jgi:cytochrome P450